MKSFYSIFQRVIVQSRDTNFAICMWFEVLVKHLNEALSMSFILLQTLDFNKASNSSELISWFEYQWHMFEFFMTRCEKFLNISIFFIPEVLLRSSFKKLVPHVSSGFPNTRKTIKPLGPHHSAFICFLEETLMKHSHSLF